LAGAAVGAALGGLGAQVSDAGFPDDHFQELGRELTPGTSMLVVEVEQAWVDEVHHELLRLGAKTIRHVIPVAAAQPLQESAGTAPGPSDTRDSVVSGPVEAAPTVTAPSPAPVESTEPAVSPT
jgi:uncharacterized membrane protein